MADVEKPESPISAVIGALAAILTLLASLLYYAGYLFLLGYYRAFNIPIGLLDLSFEQVATAGVTLILPLSSFVLIPLLIVAAVEKSFTVFDVRKWLRNAVFYCGLLSFCLLMTFLTPPTGVWFANQEIAGQWSAYAMLAEPPPYVSVYTREAIPGMAGNEAPAKEGVIYAYHNLRLIVSTKDELYLFDSSEGTIAIKRDAVTMMSLYGNRVAGRDESSK